MYPASRWQQLKQSIGVTSARELEAAEHPTALTLQTRRHQSSTDLPGSPADVQAVQQEAADVLRRCADAGAALQESDTMSASAVLAAAVQPLSKDQFAIQRGGSITCSWASAEGTSEWDQTRALPELSFERELSTLQLDSQLTADKSLTRRSPSKPPLYSPTKQQQHQHAVRPPATQPARRSTLGKLPSPAPRLSAPAVTTGNKMVGSCSKASRPATSNVDQGQQLLQLSRQKLLGSFGCTDVDSRTAGSSNAARLAVPASTAAEATRAPAISSPLILQYRDVSQQQELCHELALMRARKLLQCWRQRTADAQLDKARARPMQKLLSKRKAMCAWKAATWQIADREGAAAAESGCMAVTHPINHPGNQPGRHTEQKQQQQSPQEAQQLSKCEHVAEQFHRLYRLHSCLARWHTYAVAAVLARRMAETDRVVAQQEAEIQQRQQELDREQLEQQLYHQEQRRQAIAIRFHQMYCMHRAFLAWHKTAAMTAALNKLHPATPAVGSLCDTALKKSWGAAAIATDIVQHKAQQLLLRLAGKQQQELHPHRHAKQPKHLQQNKEAFTSQQSHDLRVADVVHQQGQLSQPQPAVADDAELLLQCLAALPCQLQAMPAPAQQTQAMSKPGLAASTPAAKNVYTNQSGLADAGVSNIIAAVEPVLPAESGIGSSARGTAAQQAGGKPQDVAAGSDASCETNSIASTPGSPACDALAVANADEAADHSQDAAAVSLLTVQQQPDDGPVEDEARDVIPTAQEQQEQQEQKLAVGAQQLHDQPLPPPPQQQQQWQCVVQQCSVVPHAQQPNQVQQQQVSATCTSLNSTPRSKQKQQHQGLSSNSGIDRQKLQQHLRQLLAVEQRKQREEQLREQQLRLKLSAQQSALAAMHYKLVLVRRFGVKPWKALVELRQQQDFVAVNWRATGLARAALLVWKHWLLHRRKRQICCHIRAFGKLQRLQQQQQQYKALNALSAWAAACKQYQRQLLLRMLSAWRQGVVATQRLLQEAKALRQGRTQCAVLKAWQQYMEQEAQEQLLFELEGTAVGAKWRHSRQQRLVLLTWHNAAAAATHERQQEARRLEQWGKVQGWLSDIKASKQNNSAAYDNGRAGDATVESAVLSGAAVAAGAVPAPTGRAVQINCIGSSSAGISRSGNIRGGGTAIAGQLGLRAHVLQEVVRTRQMRPLRQLPGWDVEIDDQ